MKITLSFKPIFFLFLPLVLVITSFFIYKFLSLKTFQAQKETQLLKEKVAQILIGRDDGGEKNDFSKIIEDYNKKCYEREKILKKSENIKGVYITKYVANAGEKDLAAQEILNRIKKIVDETEINGVVIDVKDEFGFQLSENLKKLIDEFHQKNIWVIARIVVFREASFNEKNRDFYLQKKDKTTWRDGKGYFWLDPASSQVQKSIIDLSLETIDFGFDEIQFDYLRFPHDDQNAIYPFYDKKSEKKEIIRDFYLKIRNNLREHKSDIILSVDLFGENAIKFSSPEIGQDLINTIDIFDYISFMLYPSHFYFGFEVKADEKRNLPALHFPAQDKDPNKVVSNHPYEVILRSIFSAEDFISSVFEENLKLGRQPHCLSQNLKLLFCPKPKIRPWLQNFDLKRDTDRGIFYDAQKVKAQIKAAQDAQASGWLLWDPSNIYTIEALSR